MKDDVDFVAAIIRVTLAIPFGIALGSFIILIILQ